MPTLIRILRDGTLYPVDYHAESLNDAAHHEPDDGVYTVTNTFNTFQTLRFDAHLNRMEDSARRAGIDLHLDRAALKRALREMIAEADFGDVRFRVTVPRVADHLILTLEPFHPVSPELIASGVRVITAPDSARHNPAAKTTDWMHKRRAIAELLPEGVYDAILLDANGFLMEALGANFYAVLDGELRTAGDGVLPGIAQSIVFEIAPSILPVRREAVHVREVSRLSEAFITSSSRGIVPVVEIDGQSLGNGTPGTFTRRLRDAYQAWVAEHLEDL